MKITRRQLRKLISEVRHSGEKYKLPHGPWKRMWNIMSRQPKYSELMTDENARIFKTAWDRAASSYDLGPERVAAEMKSQLALTALEREGQGPEAMAGETEGPDWPLHHPDFATTGDPELDVLLRSLHPGHVDLSSLGGGVGDGELSDAEAVQLDALADDAIKDALSEHIVKITRRQLRSLIKEEMSRLINEQDYDESNFYTLEDGLEIIGMLKIVNPRLAKVYKRNLELLNREGDYSRLSMIVRQLLYDLEADTVIDDVDEFQPGFSEYGSGHGAELGGGMTSQEHYSTLSQQWKEETGDGELSPDEAARLRALTADAISDSLSDSAGDHSIDIQMTEIEESGFGQWGRDLAKALGYSDVEDMDPYMDSDDYGKPWDAWNEGVSALEYAKRIAEMDG